MLIVKSNEPIPSRTIGKTKTRLSENRKNKNKGTSSSEPSTTSGFNKPPSSAEPSTVVAKASYRNTCDLETFSQTCTFEFCDGPNCKPHELLPRAHVGTQNEALPRSSRLDDMNKTNTCFVHFGIFFDSACCWTF
ncbi:hypothetical protein Syun_010746 [Stephania yunnanensis]|uniref:Uncharacterized protein n=1 Tax=Stephania yunnanensis TaxID=152371 RepID=A0AAP0PQ88_9MAGN